MDELEIPRITDCSVEKEQPNSVSSSVQQLHCLSNTTTAWLSSVQQTENFRTDETLAASLESDSSTDICHTSADITEYSSLRTKAEIVAELNETKRQWTTDLQFVIFFKRNKHLFSRLCRELLRELSLHCQNVIKSQLEPYWDEKLKTYYCLLHKNNIKADISEELKRQEEALALKSNLNELIMQKNTYDAAMLTSMKEITVLCDEYPPKNDVVNSNKLKIIKQLIVLEKRRISSRLPIYARRDEIKLTVTANSVVVIEGETGSGKSTQIPQYISEMGIGKVICTQPRKAAAVSLASRVAEECSSSVGQIVGFSVGGCRSNSLSAENRIVFVTDHVLLDMLLNDPLLADYACVIVDEAHERSIYTDFILGFLKSTLQNRNDLKVIITSATIDTNLFTRYFDDCPVLSVSGRLFPVYIKWHDEPVKDYFKLAIDTAIYILDQYAVGDILVFLVTPDETEKACVKLMEKLMHKSEIIAIPLHGKLQIEDQQRVFNCIEGKRRIIFATNCAETSITIPGIRFVVDAGMIKERSFNANGNVFTLRVHKISRSSAMQRCGRAGRTQSGICFRLYSKENYDAMPISTKPEIHRVHLSRLVLKMIQLGITDILNFPFIEPPTADSIRKALDVLILLKAINPSPLQLTSDGMKFCKLTVEPRLARIIIDSIKLGIGLEGIIVAAALSISCNLFCRYGTEEEKNESDKHKINFCSCDGDILSAVTVYLQWKSIHKQQERMSWCIKNKINSKMISVFDNTVNELLHTVNNTGLARLIELTLPLELHDDLRYKLRFLIFLSYYDNLFEYTGHDKIGYYAKSINRYYLMHPSSTLIPLGVVPQLVVCQDMLSTSDEFLINLTPVEKQWVEFNEDIKKYIELDAVDENLAVSRKIRNLSSSILSSYNSSYKAWTLCKEILLTENIRCHLDCNVVKGYLEVTAIKHVVEKVVKIVTEDISQKRRELKKAVLRLNTPQRTIQLIIESGIRVQNILSEGEFLDAIVKLIFIDDSYPSDELVNNAIANVKVAIASFGEMYSQKIDVWMSRDRKLIKLSKITYKNASCRDALMGLDKTVTSNYKINILIKNVVNTHTKLQVNWARRPRNGRGTLVCKDAFAAVLLMRSAFPKEIYCHRVDAAADSKCDSYLFLKRLPRHISETNFLNSFKEEFRRLIDRVHFHRSQMPYLESLEYYEQLLSETLNAIGFKSEYSQIHVWPMSSNRVPIVRAEVEFYQLHDAIAARDALHDIVIDELCCEPVSARLCLTRSIRCMPEVLQLFSSTMEKIDSCLKMDQDQSVQFNIYPADAKCHLSSIVLKGYDEIKIKGIAACIEALLEPESAKVQSAEVFEYLTSKEGSKRLQEMAVDLILKLDQRTRCILIYGHEDRKVKAIIECKAFIQVLESQCGVIKLVGKDKPKGLIKEMIKRFGVNLDRLTDLSGAGIVRLNMRDGSLHVIGVEHSRQLIHDEIEACCRAIGCAAVKDECNAARDAIECIACFSSISGKSFRLQYCGHVYCTECITNQTKHALTTCKFPLNCASCNESFIIADLKNLSEELPNDKLTEILLSEFVRRNANMWHFCPTPGCTSVYKISDKSDFFNCNLCGKKTCKACHVDAHPGFTCDNIKEYKDNPDQTFFQWIYESSGKVKNCPGEGCSAIIEKRSGCNHMQCAVCNIHFCWICRALFSSSGDCYDHLSKFHGGYV